MVDGSRRVFGVPGGPFFVWFVPICSAWVVFVDMVVIRSLWQSGGQWRFVVIRVVEDQLLWRAVCTAFVVVGVCFELR